MPCEVFVETVGRYIRNLVLFIIAFLFILHLSTSPSFSLHINRVGPNESSAIAAMRYIISVQEKLKDYPLIDMDRDGSGEYGYFGELSGLCSLRAPLNAARTRLARPLLSGSFAKLKENGVVEKSGYYFKIFLPDVNGRPMPESRGGGDGGIFLNWSGREEAYDPSENYWACYAWPVEQGITGNRVFMCNQDGEVLQTSNLVQAYSGTYGGPRTGLEAYLKEQDDMSAPVAKNTTARDGGVWAVCN